MKLLPPIYCLLFTLCPVFTSGNPSDPINNFEIEKQRRSELALLNDVPKIPNIDEQIAKFIELKNNYEIEKERRRDNIPKIDELMAMLRIEREIVQNLQVAYDVPNIEQRMSEAKEKTKELRIRLQNLRVAINANPALSGSNKSTPIEFKSELFKSGKLIYADAVSYTHLTLPTNREV